MHIIILETWYLVKHFSTRTERTKCFLITSLIHPISYTFMQLFFLCLCTMTHPLTRINQGQLRGRYLVQKDFDMQAEVTRD